MANTRGSEWRRWDLHLHTKYTHLNNMYNPVSEDDYIKKIIDNGISVVGLTNYFNFSKEDYALKSKLEDKGIVVFLNLELRLTYQNKEDQCCDIHIIFDNDLDTTVIDRFLNNLDVKIDGDEKKANELQSEYDYTNATVEFDTLLKVLNKPAQGLLNHHLIGFLSRGHGNGRTSTQYEQLAKKCHFLIHSSNNSRNVTDDRKFWLDYGKPLLQSSDAHSIDSIGTKFTWIKADTTFEGLKQILYELEERVRIQETDPTLDFDKSPFTEIKILDNVKVFAKDENGNDIKDEDNIVFAQNTIPLNSGLVSIIGGRGTGKSKLVDYIANGLGKEVKSRRQYSRSGNVCVKRKVSLREKEFGFNLDKEPHIPFMYISQSEIKGIVENKAVFSEKIMELIGVTDKEIFPKDLDISDRIIQKFIRAWEIYANKDKEINRLDSIKSEINKYEGFIESIISERNKKTFVNYQTALTLLEHLTLSLKKANEIKEDICSYKKQNQFLIEGLQSNFAIGDIDLDNEIIEVFNEVQSSTNDISIPPIDNNNETLKGIERYISFLKNNIEKLNTFIENTKTQLPDYNGNLDILLDDVNSYRKKIEKLKEEKNTIERAKQDLYDIYYRDFPSIVCFIKDRINTFKENILNHWQSFVSGKDSFSEKKKSLLREILGTENDKIDLNINIIFDEQNLIEILQRSPLNIGRPQREPNALDMIINKYKTYQI